MILAVSFFGLGPAGGTDAIGADVGGVNFGGNGAGAAAAADPPLNTGGGVTAFDGAGGNGADDIGGRAAGPAPESGRIGPGRGGGGAPFPGGRGGIFIRTVSRLGAVGPAPEPAPCGNVIRTVSFFGSGESAMSMTLNRCAK